MQTTPILKNFEKSSIFGLAPALLELVRTKGAIVYLEANQTLLEQGQNLDKLYLPLTENLTLYKKNGDDFDKIGQLKPGRALFLHEVLKGLPSPLRVSCDTDVAILTIPIDQAVTVLNSYPNLTNYLLIMTRNSAARNLKHKLTDLGVSSPEIINIISQFRNQPVRFKSGDVLGVNQRGFWLINEGTIEISKKISKNTTIKASLGEGFWFGGSGLQPPFTLDYHAFAESDVELMFADLSDITEAVKSKQVLDVISFEPWLEKANYQRVDHGEISPMPGVRLSPEQFMTINKDEIDLGKLSFANSNSSAFRATLENILVINRIPFNRANIEADLALADKITPLVLSEVIEKYGVALSVTRVAIGDLQKTKLPAMTFIANRLCIVTDVMKNSVIFLDPCTGIMALSRTDFASNWDGLLIEVVKSELNGPTLDTFDLEEESQATAISGKTSSNSSTMEKKQIWGSVWRIISRFKKNIYGEFSIRFILLGFGLVSPKLTALLFDEALLIRSEKTIFAIISAIVFIGVFRLIFMAIQGRIQSLTNSRVEIALKTQTYRHLMRLPASSGEFKKLGVIQEKFESINAFRQALTEIPLAIAMNLITFVVYAGILCYYDYKLAIFGVVLLPLILLFRTMYKDIRKRNFEEAFEIQSKANSFSKEVFSGIVSIKSAGAENHQRHMLEKLFLRGAQLSKTVQLQNGLFGVFMTLVKSLATTGVLIVTAKQAIAGDISPGEFVALTMYFAALLGPIDFFAGLAEKLDMLKVTFERNFELMLKKQQESRSEALTRHVKELNGSLKAEGLYFRYPGGNKEWVLKDIDFTIHARQVVAIVGESGCGKTTLAKILAGEMQPSNGRLFFDGYDSSYLSVSSLKRQIGTVSQSNDLFRGSIKDNIAFADDSPDIGQLHNASKMANCDTFVNFVPGGFDYQLFEGGQGLSGGQRQRIGIARTLYRNPKILILDEATSALDSESEDGIFEQLSTIADNKTVIIIAHRLSTVQHADRVLVVKDGKIVEDGNHKELVQKRGHYFRLFSTQLESGVA
jgi:ABC-type bacteriocin/lantibiotic exporter with double-glycine peptidase domain/CRP-like cAMP-binding protein